MEDKQIIDLYLERNESAISQTKMKYGPYLFKISMNILGSTSDADECENETYFAAWNSIPPQMPLKLKLFLGRLVRNISIDLYRKNNAAKRGAGMEVILSELGECAPDFIAGPSENSPENELDMSELTSLMNSFLHAQSKERRVIFVKRYWYGESVADIAKETSFSESNVSTTLFRLRKELKAYLESEGVAV